MKFSAHKNCFTFAILSERPCIIAMAGTGDYPPHHHPHHHHRHDHKVAAVVYQRRARASDREPKSRERRPASLLCCNHLYIVHTCIGRTITMQVKEMNRNDARNLCTSCKSKAYASTRTNKVFTVVMFISKTVIQR